MTVSGSDLKIGDAQAASWKDETSQSCKVEITFTPAGGSSKTITSGEKIAEAGKLTVKVTDDAGNSSSKEITLTTIDSVPPEISVEIDEVNVIAGLAVTIDGGQLKIGAQAVASWKDDYSEECEVSLTYTTTEGAEEQTVEPGSILSNAGKLTLSITDSQGNEAKAEIALTSIAVTGLESLKDRDFQVDSKTSLLEGVTITESLTLVKTEITSGTTGETATIEDPANFIPELPGTASLTLTLSRPDGTLITETLEGLTIRPLVYSTEGLTIKPLDYYAPTLKTADVINEHFQWYNVLTEKTKVFIYKHILTSYIASERYKKDNMEYIIMGEVPKGGKYENI